MTIKLAALFFVASIANQASAQKLTTKTINFAAPIIQDRNSLPGDVPFGSIVYDNAAAGFFGLGANGVWRNFGGAAGANRSLSNLTAPTAINQELRLTLEDNAIRTNDKSVSGRTGNILFATGANTSTGDGSSGRININTGTVKGTEESGSIGISTGRSETTSSSGEINIGSGDTGGSSGRVSIVTGSGSNSGDLNLSTGSAAQSGNVSLTSGPVAGGVSSGTTGNVQIYTAYNDVGPSGAVLLQTGHTSENSGDISILTGEGADGIHSVNSGKVLIQTGGASNTSGDIVLQTGPGTLTRGIVSIQAAAINLNGAPLSYTPSNSSNWSPAPTSVQEALDQLAARVKALEP